MINPQELLSVINEQDQPVETLPRSEVHAKMLLHRISHIWVVNENGLVLCQKRSDQKDRWPGMWECWFGGHVLVDQTYLESAIIETKEEIGLSVSSDELHLFEKKKVATKEENVIISVYGLQRSLDIDTMKLDAEEVDQVEWSSPVQLQKIYEDHDSQWVRYGHELNMLSWLAAQFPHN